MLMDGLWMQAPVAIIIIVFISLLLKSDSPYSGFPHVGKFPNDFRFRKAKANYAHSARLVLAEGLRKLSGPFQVVTSIGPKIILPNRYADQIRNNPDLSFAKQISKEFLGHLPGLEAFQTLHGSLLVDTIRTKLTQSLNYIIEDLSIETAAALSEKLGESKEWRTLNVSQESLYLIARLSTLIFIGPDLCRREDWLQMAGSYTINVMMAAQRIRSWPWFLRYIVSLILRESRTLRRNVREARQMVEPIVAKRREERRRLTVDGKPPKSKDTIGWMDDLAKGQPYDFTLNQLFLTGAAIHTTSNMVGNAILDLCANLEYVEPLRAEIRAAIKEDGWKKTALYKMRLMDSFLKESQRLNPPTLVVMSRQATKKVQLSDGTVIPKGADLTCTTERMIDPSIYEDPEKFDGYRFLKKRQIPGQENNWQLVTTSSDHLGFGHGMHACPGRFFAANEAKVAFAYLVIHYDWRFPKEQLGRPQGIVHDEQIAVHPLAQVEYRRTGESL